MDSRFELVHLAQPLSTYPFTVAAQGRFWSPGCWLLIRAGKNVRQARPDGRLMDLPEENPPLVAAASGWSPPFIDPCVANDRVTGPVCRPPVGRPRSLAMQASIGGGQGDKDRDPPVEAGAPTACHLLGTKPLPLPARYPSQSLWAIIDRTARTTHKGEPIDDCVGRGRAGGSSGLYEWPLGQKRSMGGAKDEVVRSTAVDPR